MLATFQGDVLLTAKWCFDSSKPLNSVNYNGMERNEKELMTYKDTELLIPIVKKLTSMKRCLYSQVHTVNQSVIGDQ